MTAFLPPHDTEAEQSLLGAVLVAQDGRQMLARLTIDAGLRPEHFYRDRHRWLFEAMLTLADRPEPVDVLTVTVELGHRGLVEECGGRDYAQQLANWTTSLANLTEHAAIVRDLAFRRQVLDTARRLGEAAVDGDRERIAALTGELLEPDTADRSTTVTSRQDQFVEHFESEVTTVPWPFARLNDLTGGLWPGHFTLLIGVSGHGKSVMADQILETARKHGASCCAYLTEMTPLERDLRFAARRTDIPLRRLMRGHLEQGEHRRIVEVAKELPFEIVPAGTWTVPEVGRDIRRRRLDVAVIDLLNAISGRETRDIDENVARLAGIANDTGCHIVACNHLNRSRLTGATYPPEPSQGDIRGSGSLFDLSTNVLSVYRHEREERGERTGEPGDQATVRFLKVKNGLVGWMDARFNGSRMRFELPREPGVVGSVAA